MKSLILTIFLSIAIPLTFAQDEWHIQHNVRGELHQVLFLNEETGKVIAVAGTKNVTLYAQGSFYERTTQFGLMLGTEKSVKKLAKDMGAKPKDIEQIVSIDKDVFFVDEIAYQVKNEKAFLKLIENAKKSFSEVIAQVRKGDDVSEELKEKIIKISEKDLEKDWGLTPITQEKKKK